MREGGLCVDLRAEGTPAAHSMRHSSSIDRVEGTYPGVWHLLSWAAEGGTVMRRLSATLAIWLSLLGVAMPVLACSMGVDADGCCPVRTQSACGGSGESQWNATVAPPPRYARSVRCKRLDNDKAGQRSRASYLSYFHSHSARRCSTDVSAYRTIASLDPLSRTLAWRSKPSGNRSPFRSFDVDHSAPRAQVGWSSTESNF
jgi:hypothetical protein